MILIFYIVRKSVEFYLKAKTKTFIPEIFVN